MNDTSTYVYKVLGTGILAYDGNSTVLTTGSTTVLHCTVWRMVVWTIILERGELSLSLN